MTLPPVLGGGVERFGTSSPACLSRISHDAYALLPILVAHGELLPLTSRRELWISDATGVVDAMDGIASGAVRSSSNRLMRIGQRAFGSAPLRTLATLCASNHRYPAEPI
ncbi:MAG: hypothetical protein IPM29_24435 [Planctomycetes bacterium]|nr:hypothetical protein [Planctomycetota bacterium]